MFKTRALLGLIGVPSPKSSPAAQRMPAITSASLPPHFPKTRTGITFTPRATPAIPTLLLVAAPIRPSVCVPCHELFVTGQPASVPEAASALVMKSPGSLASASRPLPSPAEAKLVPVKPSSGLTMS